MAYTPEQLSDRAEILDIVHRYAWSIDTRDWDALDSCFAEDAYVDYSSNPGGTEGPYREVRGWLEEFWDDGLARLQAEAEAEEERGRNHGG